MPLQHRGRRRADDAWAMSRTIQVGPEMRRGIAELNGEGEVAGGVVILRSGKNARETITAVHDKLHDPEGRACPRASRSSPPTTARNLIDRAINNLSFKLLEEFIVVALVCGAVPLARALGAGRHPLPAARRAGRLHASCSYQGVNANIMSLGGIAIAIGAMVDAAVVMIENAHKHIETLAA
ncbi:MAG: efflux RND transporter permease subunit [Stutzerimonas stutzeri]